MNELFQMLRSNQLLEDLSIGGDVNNGEITNERIWFEFQGKTYEIKEATE